MKHRSLCLSIFLTAKGVVAVPPPDCDNICAAAQKWDVCVTSYKGPVLSQTAKEFCWGNGLTDSGKACKLCQNNGYGTGPNHRPGGPPRLGRRIDNPCASLCGGPDNTENWGPGCDGICSTPPAHSGPNRLLSAPPLVRRQRVPPRRSESLSLAEFQARCVKLKCPGDNKGDKKGAQNPRGPPANSVS